MPEPRGPPMLMGATGVCGLLGMFVGMMIALYPEPDLSVGMLAVLASGAVGAIAGALAGGLIGYCVDRVNGFRSSTVGGLIGCALDYFLVVFILYFYGRNPHCLTCMLLGGLPGALVGDYIERKLLAPDRANPIGVFIAMLLIIAALASGILSWGTKPL